MHTGEELIHGQGGAQRPSDFIQQAQLLRAPAGLLVQLEVFHRHPYLSSQADQQTKLRWSQAPGFRRGQQQQSLIAAFGAQAGRDQHAHPFVPRRALQEFKFFLPPKGNRGRGLLHLRQHQQTAQPVDGVVEIGQQAEPFGFMQEAPHVSALDADLGAARVQHHHPCRQVQGRQQALQGLTDHLLQGIRILGGVGDQVKTGQFEQAALQAALFVLVEDNQHADAHQLFRQADQEGGIAGEGERRRAAQRGGQNQQRPEKEGNRQDGSSAQVAAAAFPPEVDAGGTGHHPDADRNRHLRGDSSGCGLHQNPEGKNRRQQSCPPGASLAPREYAR